MTNTHTPIGIHATSTESLQRGQSALWDAFCDLSDAATEQEAILESEDNAARLHLNDEDIANAVESLTNSGVISEELAEAIERRALEWATTRLRFAAQLAKEQA
jgi:hypothetical protein